ncbi:helix-turn-helix transcriptional regulator [Tistrella mobilis]
MLTAFGKELRKLRVDRNQRLLDMAQEIGRSVSFLSAIEIGRREIPKGFDEEIIKHYSLCEEEAEKLRKAYDLSRRTFLVEAEEDNLKETVGLFARKVNSLSSDDLQSIQRILKGGRTVDNRR